MSEDFDRILDECLDRINSGQSLEECLKLYPKFARELKPLLRVASELHNKIASMPSQAAWARGRQRLLQAMAELEQKRQQRQQSWFQQLLGKSRTWAPIAAAIVLAIVGYALWVVLTPTLPVPPAVGPTTPPTSPVAPTTAMGTAVFYISDAAADMGEVSSVQITVDSLRVHSQSGVWTTVPTTGQTYDLLELKATGTGKLLAEADLQAGNYDQFELNISKVMVVDDEGSHEAKLPSGKLDIEATLEAKEGATATANFDFATDQSLHLTDEGKYILAPVIQAETRDNAHVQVSANKEVRVSGGRVVAQVKVGMDAAGKVGTGLQIDPDVVLHIDPSGKVVKVEGQAAITGTIKAVDITAGTVTIMTEEGGELVLCLSRDSKLLIDSSASTVAGLGNRIGDKIRIQYDLKNRTVTNAHVLEKAREAPPWTGKSTPEGR